MTGTSLEDVDVLKGLLLGVAIAVLAAISAAVVFLRTTGLSARAAPAPAEAVVSRWARAIALPSEYASRRNPVPATADSIRNGMEHFADHCASCHANDGSGDVEMGRGLFPPAPDMRAAGTQAQSDAALFYVIERGIRFTGMPAWGTGTPEGEESSWHLVNFIRHLPNLTDDELERMAALNPRSPEEVRQEIEEERFLSGAGP